MKAAVIVPTIRQDRFEDFYGMWWNEIRNHRLIVVEGRQEASLTVPQDGTSVHIYSWDDIEADFEDDAWIFPKDNAGVRAYGYWKAIQTFWDIDMLVTLDDDCVPAHQGVLEAHWNMLNESSARWWSPPIGFRVRGTPYRNLGDAETVLNCGLWTGVPDVDAVTQLAGSYQELRVTEDNWVVPRGLYYPQCGMNLAWKPDATVALWFGIFGHPWPYHRFDDIWAGVIFKRIADHLGKVVRCGYPYVKHTRASDVWDNLRREATTYEINESFWQGVDEIPLRGDTWKRCYLEIAERLPFKGDYWDSFRRGMKIWAGAFTK